MVRYIILIIFFALLLQQGAIAQSIDTLLGKSQILTEEEVRSNLLDNISNATSEEIFTEQTELLIDQLDYLFNSPISITGDHATSLLEVPSISRLDVSRFLRARRYSSALSPLQLLATLNHSSANAASPYLNSASKKSALLAIRTKLILDLNAKDTRDYISGHLRGSPIRTSTSILARSSEVEFSLTQSKSAGEPLYLDHLVGSISLRSPQLLFHNLFLKNICIGNYSLSYGNGLLFSSGVAQSPSPQSIINPMLSSEGLRPYHSTSSIRYFQGASAELSNGNFQMSGFFSDRKIDADIDSGKITYLPESGLHRTPLELDRRNATRQTLYGGNLVYSLVDSSYNGLSLAVTGYSMKFDLPIFLKDTTQYAFQGRHHSMASAYCHIVYSPFAIDAEYAKTFSDWVNTSAYAITAIIDPIQSLRLTINYHNLPRDFYSPFGGTFGVHSDEAQNEKGYYAGLLYNLFDALTLYSYFLNTTNIIPSVGASISRTYSQVKVGGSYEFQNSLLDVFFRSNSGSILSYDSILPPKYDARISFRHHFTHNFSATTRIQYALSNVSDHTEEGKSILLAFNFIPFTKTSILFGTTFYKTTSFANRLFAIEADLPGNTTFVQLYGRGARYYLVCQHSPSPLISLSASIAQSIFTYPIGASQTQKVAIGAQCEFRL